MVRACYLTLLVGVAGCSLSFLVAGCAPTVGWLRQDIPPVVSATSWVAVSKDSEEAQIWSHTTVAQWHSVVATRDSITGIPFQRSMPCDSCRHSLSRAEVDSIRLPHTAPAARIADNVFGIGWRRRDLPGTPKAKVDMQIWSHGTAADWRAIIVTRDSITGIPAWAMCYSCRRGLSRADVDSIRRLHAGLVPEAVGTVLGYAIAITVVQAFVFEATGRCFFVIRCGHP